MDGRSRVHYATRLVARDAVSKDRQDRKAEMRKTRGAVELFLSVFFHQS